MDRAYPIPLFSKPFLRRLGLLPTEYLFFYYSPHEALRKTVASGNSRGGLIQTLENRLMRAVAESGRDEAGILDAYDLYLASRNASYMMIETGGRLAKVRGRRGKREALSKRRPSYERIASTS